MSLWPGYYRTKNFLEPIVSEIPKMRVDTNQDPDIRFETSTGNFYISSSMNRIRSANGRVAIEDFGAGETITWMFPHDEFHWVLRGEADMTYSLAGNSHTEQKKVSLKEGDIFLIPLGARVTFKVGPTKPLRRLVLTLPGPANSESVLGKTKKTV
ncbi:cupin domain-containing protein [Chloroflexota bacterium]